MWANDIFGVSIFFYVLVLLRTDMLKIAIRTKKITCKKKSIPLSTLTFFRIYRNTEEGINSRTYFTSIGGTEGTPPFVRKIWLII